VDQKEQSETAEPSYWQDPLWRTWRPTVAAAVAVGIGVGLAEWFAWDRLVTYALVVFGVLLGYTVFGLWLLVKRR